MFPIPKKLLIHGCELVTELPADKWGNVSNEVTPMLNVRIESCVKSVINSDGVTVQLSATLLYDCVNSSPKDVVFRLHGDGCERQAVIFDGRRYIVGTVEPLYDERRLHHYEVGLI